MIGGLGLGILSAIQGRCKGMAGDGSEATTQDASEETHERAEVSSDEGDGSEQTD